MILIVFYEYRTYLRCSVNQCYTPFIFILYAHKFVCKYFWQSVFLWYHTLNIALVLAGVEWVVAVHSACAKVLWEFLWSTVERCGHGVNRGGLTAICGGAGSVHRVLGLASITLEPFWIFESVWNFLGFVKFRCLCSLWYFSNLALLIHICLLRRHFKEK